MFCSSCKESKGSSYRCTNVQFGSQEDVSMVRFDAQKVINEALWKRRNPKVISKCSIKPLICTPSLPGERRSNESQILQITRDNKITKNLHRLPIVQSLLLSLGDKIPLKSPYSSTEMDQEVTLQLYHLKKSFSSLCLGYHKQK